MITTLIFDLDGTLLNTLEDLTNSTNFVLNIYNYPLKSMEEVKSFVGNGVEQLIEKVVPSGKNNPHYTECLHAFKEHYSKTMDNTTHPYDGISGMLTVLRQNHCKMAVVSNKFEHAVQNLCNKHFGDNIQVAMGASEHIRKKPAPDSVLEAMKQLGAHRDETLYIGDSEVDVQTAKNAQLSCIGVTWGYRNRDLLRHTGADYLADSPQELLNLIKTLNSGDLIIDLF